jgi:hypothetical protein
MTTVAMHAPRLDRARLARALQWVVHSAEARSVLGGHDSLWTSVLDLREGLEVGGVTWRQGRYLTSSRSGELSGCIASWIALDAAGQDMEDAGPLAIEDEAAAALLGYVPTRGRWLQDSDPAGMLARLFSVVNTVGDLFDRADDLANAFGMDGFEIERGQVR